MRTRRIEGEARRETSERAEDGDEVAADGTGHDGQRKSVVPE